MASGWPTFAHHMGHNVRGLPDVVRLNYTPEVVPISTLRCGDYFYDSDTQEWLRCDVGASDTYVQYMDTPTGCVEWRADGHKYHPPKTDKNGNPLHIWVMRK